MLHPQVRSASLTNPSSRFGLLFLLTTFYLLIPLSHQILSLTMSYLGRPASLVHSLGSSPFHPRSLPPQPESLHIAALTLLSNGSLLVSHGAHGALATYPGWDRIENTPNPQQVWRELQALGPTAAIARATTSAKAVAKATAPTTEGMDADARVTPSQGRSSRARVRARPLPMPVPTPDLTASAAEAAEAAATASFPHGMLPPPPTGPGITAVAAVAPLDVVEMGWNAPCRPPPYYETSGSRVRYGWRSSEGLAVVGDKWGRVSLVDTSAPALAAATIAAAAAASASTNPDIPATALGGPGCQVLSVGAHDRAITALAALPPACAAQV